MKTFTSLIASLVVLAAASPASAQDHNLRARVPFEFMVGKTTLPRDTYQLSRANGHTDVLMLRSLRRGLFIVGQRGESNDRSETPKLVFHRYGEKYFLREIRYSGGLALTLRETRDEREAAGRRADRSGAGVIFVAALL